MDCSHMKGTIGCAVPGRDGKELSGLVSAVFSKAAHLQTGNRVFTIGSPDLPSHPYTIRTSGFPKYIKKGMPFRFLKQSLSIGDSFKVDFEGWPVFTPTEKINSIAGLPEISNAVNEAKSVASKYKSNVGGFHAMFSESFSRDFVIEHLIFHARLLSDHIYSKEWDMVAKEAGHLVGVGRGLTPSGDDFLCGVLSGLWFHRNNGGEDRTPSLNFFKDIAAELKNKTSPFSACLLSSAARGWQTSLVEDWLVAVHSKGKKETRTASNRLLAVGHSSGMDTLAGLIVTMEGLLA